MTHPLLLLCEAFFIAALLLLLYQDLKTRSAHVMLLALLVLLALGHGSSEAMQPSYWQDKGVNLLLLLTQGVLLRAYLWWKGIKPSAGIGLGDVLFWVVPALYLKTLSFALFFPISLCFSLLLHLLLVALFGEKYGSTVPLAGLQALCLAGWIGFSQLGFTTEDHFLAVLSSLDTY